MSKRVDGHSEFEGGGLMPNTVFPKGPDALTPSDKLRLDSITGQDEDSRAPVDPWHWQGGQYHPSELEQIEIDRRARVTQANQLRRQEAQRYRESPY